MVLRVSAVKNPLFSALLIVFSLSVSSQIQAKQEPATINTDESTVYYNVDATTIAGLRTQMQQRGQKGYPGYASWDINWPNAGKCKKVDLKIRYHLPRHTKLSSTSEALQTEWNRFLGALRTHENNHGSHAKQGAKAMADSNCKKPQDNLNWIRKQDKDYDNRTNHGKSEGAWIRDLPKK